jgi:hypothetical protein
MVSITSKFTVVLAGIKSIPAAEKPRMMQLTILTLVES